jgi:integrase
LAERRGNCKPASLVVWGHVVKNLIEFFGADCPLKSITPERAEEFHQHLVALGLRDTTIHKRLQHCRTFFNCAKRQRLVADNPFEFVKHRRGDAAERRAYVPVADVLRVMDYCPNDTWRLLLALARFGGLRIPSEAFSLKWADVDWERNRLLVPSPKTEHLPGRGYRVMPLFPLLRQYLDAAWSKAPEGAVYVIPEEYRRRAQGPGGWRNANLRTTLEKIVRRAGLTPWPRLWHSLRASCESDLAASFPSGGGCQVAGQYPRDRTTALRRSDRQPVPASGQLVSADWQGEYSLQE